MKIKTKRPLVLLLPVILALLAGGAYFLFNRPAGQTADHSQNNIDNQQKNLSGTIEEPDTTESEQTDAKAPKPDYDISSAASLTVVANKSRPLPADYVPSDLVVPDVRLRLSAGQEQMQFRKIAAEDLKNMFDAAAEEGVTLVFGSGYRSYALQKQFYDSYVARDGQAAADRYSARPGTSEHQTGLSFDATNPDQSCHLEICFEGTAQGKWLANNAHKFGFHLRYQNGKEAITGYQYEPWHFRYIGVELATELFQKNVTLEEFFNL